MKIIVACHVIVCIYLTIVCRPFSCHSSKTWSLARKLSPVRNWQQCHQNPYYFHKQTILFLNLSEMTVVSLYGEVVLFS